MKQNYPRIIEKISAYAILGLSFIWVVWMVHSTLNSGFISGWDTHGYLLQASFWFRKGGWFPSWHGGFPLFYTAPPLFTFLLGIPASFLNKNLVLNWSCALLFMGLVPVMYTFLRSFGLGRIPAAIGASFSLLIDPPFTAGITAIYRVGLLPNSLGFLLTFLLLARINREFQSQNEKPRSAIISGVFLSALILTHGFSAAWFCIAAFLLAGISMLYRPEKTSHIIKSIFIIFIIGLGLSIFWWGPFLCNRMNLNKMDSLQIFSPLETIGRMVNFQFAGGRPIMLLTVGGILTLWRTNRRNLSFFGGLFLVTLFLSVISFNFFPFGELFAAGQRIRFEGFNLWVLIVCAAFAIDGLEKLFKKLRTPYLFSIIVLCLAINGIVLYPPFSAMKGAPQIIKNNNIDSLPALGRRIDSLIKPGEFVLSEFNWDCFGIYGSPHFLNQNLPLLSERIWDIQGNLPESTRGAEKAKVLSQQMTNRDYFLGNLEYLKQRGVHYVLTLCNKTRQFLLQFPDKFQPVFLSEDQFQDSPGIFELKNFNRPFGLPDFAVPHLKDFQYSAGNYVLRFAPPVNIPAFSTFALSYHPWLEVTANGQRIPTVPNPDFLLAIRSDIVQTSEIRVAFSPPLITKYSLIFSGLFLLMVLFSLARPGRIQRLSDTINFSVANFAQSLLRSFVGKLKIQESAEPPAPVKKYLLIIFAGLFLLFSFSRFYDLAARPMHNDEGVNGFFLQNLVQSNNYKYDPQNYHGPSLYYLQLIPTWITTLKKMGLKNFRWSNTAGITETSVRSLVAFSGLLILLGLWFARHRLGWWGAFMAFILAGISPDMLFYSRYFIHEIYVVLFMFGLYLGWTYFVDTKKPHYFYLASFSGAMLFCTKETSVIIFLSLAGAFFLTQFIDHYSSDKRQKPFLTEVKNQLLEWKNTLGGHLWGGLGLIFVVCLLLFSSFFSNLKGLGDSFLTFTYWTGQGLESGHNKPFWYFIKDLFLPYEYPTVFLSLAGLGFAFALKDKKGLFLSFWTMGLLLAHSLIPYKTPWIIITLLLPTLLLAGYGFQQMINLWKERREKPLYSVVILGCVFVVLIQIFFQIPQSVKIAYIEYDDDTHKQVYVHTDRDVFRLVNDIKDLTAGLPDEKNTPINIYAAVQWPLPFYLRDYKKAYWWGEKALPTDTPIIIAQAAQEEGIKKLLKNKYKISHYLLRKGEPLAVFVDEEYFQDKRKKKTK